MGYWNVGCTTIIKGDVDLNCSVNIADALKMFKSLSGIAPELTGDSLLSANMLGMATVDSQDLLVLFEYLAGVRDQL